MNWTENKWLKPAWMGGGNDFVTKYQDKFAKIGERFAPKVETSTNKKTPTKEGVYIYEVSENHFLEFVARMELVSKLSFVKKYDKEKKEGYISYNYTSAKKITEDKKSPIVQRAYCKCMVSIVEIKNAGYDKVDYFDSYNGGFPNPQLFNIEQFLKNKDTRQFGYASIHGMVEHLYGREHINCRYSEAHASVMSQDLEYYVSILPVSKDNRLLIWSKLTEKIQNHGGNSGTIIDYPEDITGDDIVKEGDWNIRYGKVNYRGVDETLLLSVFIKSAYKFEINEKEDEVIIEQYASIKSIEVGGKTYSF